MPEGLAAGDGGSGSRARRPELVNPFHQPIPSCPSTRHPRVSLSCIRPAEQRSEAKEAQWRSRGASHTQPGANADIAPALGEYTDKVLFGDVWKRPGLSPRDRSLVTVASLVALYRTNELPFHLGKALENGVTKDDLIELITHLAFYAGWPTANTAVAIARKVFGAAE
jgi:4-carboxymuconolactone decarboxylase